MADFVQRGAGLGATTVLGRDDCPEPSEVFPFMCGRLGTAVPTTARDGGSAKMHMEPAFENISPLLVAGHAYSEAGLPNSQDDV